MLNHIEKQQILLSKKLTSLTPFKDDIRKLADLKQQTQKMILLRSTVTIWRCGAYVGLISFLIFTVLDLRVCCSRR